MRSVGNGEPAGNTADFKAGDHSNLRKAIASKDF